MVRLATVVLLSVSRRDRSIWVVAPGARPPSRQGHVTGRHIEAIGQASSLSSFASPPTAHKP